MALVESQPVNIASVLGTQVYNRSQRDVAALVASMPDPLRSRLQRMMVEAQTIVERQAAARAIVGYAPPDCRFRLAEWGVWLADADDGQLQSVLSDIPPFVHSTGDSAQSLQASAQAAFAKPFFEADGIRLLVFLSAQDYETVCPLTVKPIPIELARVGIIWAELK